MDFLVIAAVLAIVFLCGLPSNGNPIRSTTSESDLPWATPCNLGTTTSDDSSSGQGNLALLAAELHLRTLEAHGLSLLLKEDFFVSRLSSSNSMAQALDGYHLEDYPLPSDVQYWTHSNHTGEVVLNDYINLSIVMVYFEAIRFDDMEHNDNSSTTAITSLEGKLFSVLCLLNEMLNSLNLSVQNHVTRDVMPASLREIPTIAQRHQRDYIMAKDCLHFLTSTKNSHMAMKLGLA